MCVPVVHPGRQDADPRCFMAGAVRALSAMSPAHNGKLLHRQISRLDFSIGMCFGPISFFPPLLRVLLKCLTGNTSEAKEDAISSQRITGVSAARMRTARASGATEGLRSRDLNKRQQRHSREDLTCMSKMNRLA